MAYILSDYSDWQALLPLTYTRGVADIRVGILTQREKWNMHLQTVCGVQTQDFLTPLYPKSSHEDTVISIRASLLPTAELVQAIRNLSEGKALVYNDVVLAASMKGALSKFDDHSFEKISYSGKVELISHPWDIFRLNASAIEQDFALLTKGKKSVPLSSTNTVIGKGSIFLEEGARCEASVLNTNEGPIYIGKNAEVMEGCLIRGPFALCNDSQLKMGAKIYGATTIGPHCKVGGEVNNSVIFGFSNKAHDGFLGNSVIGEWCNLGADTNNSNLKNNYGEVKVWSYKEQKQVSTGLQFCGLMMGDHSKSGINTMFNTGTVVGVCANVFGGGFPDKHIPSFAWGGADGFEKFELEKAFDVMEKVMERRHVPLTAEMKAVIRHLSDRKA